jgi:hypothetical protein
VKAVLEKYSDLGVGLKLGIVEAVGAAGCDSTGGKPARG